MTLDLTPGAIIGGRYALDCLVGEGGMGVVWRAHAVEGGGEVALKFLRRGSEAAPGAHRRVLREARAASAVAHPHVVAVQEILELEDGLPVLVMELLAGESLARKLERERTIAAGELAGIMLPVVSGVGEAHARGVIHRDLKPENIFLVGESDAAPTVKVLDFGIAKQTAVEGDLATQTAGLTISGSLLGTPCYMSPEQAFSDKDVDHRTDIWSLGIILYECLSGTLPTKAENLGQVLKLVLTRPVPSLRRAAPNVPAALCALVDRMLSRSRDQRPADLREVARVLEALTDVRAPAFGAPVELRTIAKPADETADSAADEGIRTLDLDAPPPPVPPKSAASSASALRAAIVVAGAAVVIAAVSLADHARSGRSAESEQHPMAPVVPVGSVLATNGGEAMRPTPTSTPEPPAPASATGAPPRGMPSTSRRSAPAPPAPSATAAAKPAPVVWPAEFGGP